jgi:monofunctional biosynthetic peptidoglycan transglycosylase
MLTLLILPYLTVPLYRFLQPVSTPMLWRWATGARVERIFVPLGRIAPSLPLTVVVSEDGSFCHNRGIDLGAVREALQQADEDIAEARGGSTITQQTAKNLFLWQRRSLIRKALEFPLALWINLVLPTSCRIRFAAARGRPARRYAGSRASMSAAPPRIRRWMPVSAPTPPSVIAGILL